MNRAGLLNFWYYDEEIFTFADGKLLLRGTNGSGKSVTMQSFIPVLLDGKKSPDRLDPFGSKARKMSDYLLGEEEITHREERTGYLFLEYKMAGTEQYITTGIGMQARRHKDLKSWYFLITDNRRIGIDFELAHKSSSEVVPYSQKELQHRIGMGGMVVDSQGEYAELVNKHVFGFETMEAYEDLVKLLIQLRAPKLSKDFKPTVIYEILESALPPLTDDELRHLSDTIESMDQTEQQLEQLKQEYTANAKIKAKYDLYNQYILAERAHRLISAQEKVQKYEAEQAEYQNEQLKLKEEIEILQQEKRQVFDLLQVMQEEQKSLETHEVWRLQKELTTRKLEKEQHTTTVVKLEKIKDSEEVKRIHQLEAKRGLHDELAALQKEQVNLIEELTSLAADASFDAHTLNIDSFQRGTLQFSYWEQEVQQHVEQLRKMKKLISEEQFLKEKDHELERSSSEKKKSIDLMQKELEQTERWFDEELQKLEHALFNWIDDHKELTFSTEQQQELSRIVHGLYEAHAFYEVPSILMEGINSYQAKLEVSLQTNRQKQAESKQRMDQLLVSLDTLRNQEMADPPRAEGTLAFRETLTQKEIPFVPIYAAVEFQQHVTDTQKSRLEAVLATTGILDSLISPQKFEVEEDALLRPNEQLIGYTLADFLQPDVEVKGISSALVEEVLRSIPVQQEGETFFIDEHGFYTIGCVVGHAPNQGPSKYIGRTSRKRYQQEQIEQVIVQINLVKEEQQQLLIQQEGLLQQVKEAKQWQQTLPTDRIVYEIDEEIRRSKTKQQVLIDELQQVDAKWQQTRQQLRTISQQLVTVRDTVNLALTKEAFSEALDMMDVYRRQLSDLKVAVNEQRNLQLRLNENINRIEELDITIDRYHNEIIDLQYVVEKVQAEIISLQEQLKLQGVEEIQQRIAKVQLILEEHTNRYNIILETLPKQEQRILTVQEKLNELLQELEFYKLMERQWYKAFKEELDLGFIPVESQEVQAVAKQYKEVLKQDRLRLQEQLTKTYNFESNHLMEYRMRDYLKETEPLSELSTLQDERMDSYMQLRSRRIIELEYRGQRVSPYYIDEVLDNELADRTHLLGEQDRELYEDIIVNSVGTILRQRISRATQWVKEMDQIMAKRDNSSGLIFSISWKPRTAEAEDELDTRDLVQLLQRKSNFLSEEDLSKITKHFRSRIESAKESVSLRNEGAVLHQVLKEVLDYRKWFSFVLSFTRQNETKKELTNNAFYKFSGGEKAMAMYIPLFTAAYSRYKEASEMAPYIISLDEAFAGVDEQNIRDMFEVVEQLGFNYIINSQVIWGDYDTVSSLGIAELVRPKNADYVTVLNYKWNGKERILNE